MKGLVFSQTARFKQQKTVVYNKAMQEIPYNLAMDFSTQSNDNESSLLRENICMRCWQDTIDTSEYAEIWLNEYKRVCSAVILENLGISTQNGCTWCHLLKTHDEGWGILGTKACLGVVMNILPCHDSRITAAGGFDLEVDLRTPSKL